MDHAGRWAQLLLLVGAGVAIGVLVSSWEGPSPEVGAPLPSESGVEREGAEPALAPAPEASWRGAGHAHGDAAKTPKSRPAEAATTHDLRLVDRAGRPIRGATVTFEVRARDGTRVVREASTDASGAARLDVPEGTLVRVRVDVGTGAANGLALERAAESGLDLREFDEIVAQEHAVLALRTVDTRGNPRPLQRILYRRAGQAGGWWGETSDASGTCVVGTFPLHTRLEVRPGPRGLDSGQIDNPRGWQMVVVDGSVVDLEVGDEPRLRLRVRGTYEPLQAPVAVLDATTGEPLFPTHTATVAPEPWSAPALVPGKILEVLVGPLEDGRWKRMGPLVAQEEPIDVDLLPGTPLRGRVEGSSLPAGVRGRVRAVGRGFAVERAIAADGTFEFPGLPDEQFVVAATLDGSGHAGEMLRESGTYVVVPVSAEARKLQSGR